MTCRHCGREHSDWVGCEMAVLDEVPPPYTSGGVPDVPFDPVPEVKYDRSKAMREFHARRKAK